MLLHMLDAIRDISHVTDRNRTGLLIDGHIDDGPADLVLHVAHDALVFGAPAGSGRTQAPLAPPPFRFAAEGFVQFRQAFGVALLLIPPLATGDDRRLLLVACYRRVDL